MKRLGLIINPIAGIGGRVGLKGSDGAGIQSQALALGAEPGSHLRAALALERLLPFRDQFQLVTPPALMGGEAARQCGFDPLILGTPANDVTSAEDTIRAAQQMLALPVDLLLFAGGDGTARDIAGAVGTDLACLGIPAGVKIHSAVFATSPRAAGELAVGILKGEKIRLHEAEVIDLDENEYRAGKIDTRFYRVLKIPYLAALVQNKKTPSPEAEPARLDSIAADVIERMEAGWLYVLGPGTTTRAVTIRLGLPKTLIGVDVITREKVIAQDAGERLLLELLQDRQVKIIVTPIGGQGFLFGRGNQQISPSVIRRVGKEHLIVVSLVEKLNALRGNPLLVDSGDVEVDALLTGYIPVITGFHERVMYRISS